MRLEWRLVVVLALAMPDAAWAQGTQDFSNCIRAMKRVSPGASEETPGFGRFGILSFLQTGRKDGRGFRSCRLDYVRSLSFTPTDCEESIEYQSTAKDSNADEFQTQKQTSRVVYKDGKVALIDLTTQDEPAKKDTFTSWRFTPRYLNTGECVWEKIEVATSSGPGKSTLSTRFDLDQCSLTPRDSTMCKELSLLGKDLLSGMIRGNRAENPIGQPVTGAPQVSAPGN